MKHEWEINKTHKNSKTHFKSFVFYPNSAWTSSTEKISQIWQCQLRRLLLKAAIVIIFWIQSSTKLLSDGPPIFLITFVIYRKVGLQTPSNLLLGSLAVSDILVGLLVQPGYVAYRLVENRNGFVPCAIRMLFSIGFYNCYGVSFMTLCTISCERLIALLYHLRYRSIVNRQRVLKTVLFIWVVNILLKLLQWAHNHTFRGIHLSLWLASLFIAVATQCRIFYIIRHHQRQIQQLHSMTSTRQMQIKLAINVASIIAIYCAFNLPVLVITTSDQIVQRHIESYNVYSWAETTAFMTSTVNPLVCFWRVKTIRNAIIEFLPRLRRKKKKLRELPFDNHVVLVRFRHITPP